MQPPWYIVYASGARIATAIAVAAPPLRPTFYAFVVRTQSANVRTLRDELGVETRLRFSARDRPPYEAQVYSAPSQLAARSESSERH